METLSIPVVYEGGVFRPLVKIDLPEHTSAQVQIPEPATRQRFSFIGILNSGEGDLSERVEEIMEQALFDPHEGWSFAAQDA
jgi:predicted DNA-binding antitoxin AbrB/MazE fold protein